MKQKKNTKTERNTAGNRWFLWKNLLLGLLFLAICGAGIWLWSYFREVKMQTAVEIFSMTAIGMAVLGLYIRRDFAEGRIEEQNQKHFKRFWNGFFCSLALTFACVFLPVEGWPFMAVFVLLALYSTPVAGILGGTVLLMLAVLLAEAGAGVFFLYLLSGILAVSLFCPLGEDVKIGFPLFLSVFGLLVCETAGIVLPANARPTPDMFLVPVVNMILSTILLIGIVKLFSAQVVYHYREKYLELNDTEYPILSEYRKEQREEYMASVHTVYFCERIADKLGLDVDALKCAGYYHLKAVHQPDFLEEHDFPPVVCRILEEYLSIRGKYEQGMIKHRETAVLFCADMVVTTIQQMIEKDRSKELNYDRIIETIFKHFSDRRVFDECDLTMKQFYRMQAIFKEEKLYYDFLR